MLVAAGAAPAWAADWFVATSGSDAATGTNWATAKRTIQAGVNVSTNGDTVWVGSGTYQERLTIPKGIWLRSANGPRLTTIFGTGTKRCITITHANAVVSGFTITGGRNEDGAGVLMLRSGGGLVERCIIVDNGAVRSGSGGGVDISVWGGGIWGGRARNCLVASNFIYAINISYMGSAGAVGAGTCETFLENCTLVDNTASANGYHEFAEGGACYGSSVNCLIWSNWSGTSYSGSHWSFNVSAPGFADGQYRLAASSLCVDAGNNQDWMASAADLDGNSRIVHGCVDLGAYERQPLMISPLGTNLSPAATSGLSFEVTAEVAWTATTNVPWLTITSGASGSTNGTVTFDVAANGTYFGRTGAILVTGGGVTWSYAVVQAAAGHQDWFVATNGNDAADGASWATAKQTIQAAVDAAAGGDAVWVSNGTYVGEIRIAKGVRIQSANGSAVTTIQGASSRCVTMSNAAAVVAGFTLTGGTADWGGGAYIDGGTLEDCVIRDNVASGRCSGCEWPFDEGQDPAFGGGVYGGVLRRCIVSNNTAKSSWTMVKLWAQGGGTYGADLYDSLVINNVAWAYHAVTAETVTAGGGTAAGTIVNCTVVGNIARVGVENLEPSRLVGGGSFNCTLQNSIVNGNECRLAYDVGWTDDVSGGTAYHSCAPDVSAENGNVTNDPQFVNSGAGNFRLAAGSPCRDAGNNAYVLGATDLDGQPRIVNGTVDMGAYEICNAIRYETWSAGITNGLTNATDCAAGDGVPNLLRYGAGCPEPMVPDGLSALQVGVGALPTLVFNRNSDAADLFWLVESAATMASGAVWRGVATNVGGSWLGATNVEESGTGNPVECAVTDPVALDSNRFLRLRVSRP